MKALLLTLLLATPLTAQNLDWKRIKEMSGDIPDHPGLTTTTSAAQIARDGDRIRLLIKFEYPWGSPGDIFKTAVPWGVDPTSISRIEAKLDFNCQTLVVKAVGNSSEVYQFNGKKHKSKEPPFAIPESHILTQYFCEVKSEKSTGPPKLEPPK